MRRFGVPTLAIVTAFLFGLTLGGWALVLVGHFLWWNLSHLVSNAITWTLAYGLGVPREMRKVLRLEHRLQIAKQRMIDQFDVPVQRKYEDRHETATKQQPTVHREPPHWVALERTAGLCGGRTRICGAA